MNGRQIPSEPESPRNAGWPDAAIIAGTPIKPPLPPDPRPEPDDDDSVPETPPNEPPPTPIEDPPAPESPDGPYVVRARH